MTSLFQLLETFALSLMGKTVLTVLSTLLVSVLSYVLSPRIRTWAKRAVNFIFDEKVELEISRIDRYDNPPDEGISIQLLSKIQDQYGDVSYEALSEDALRISSPALPAPIEVRITPIPQFGDYYEEDVPRYEVIVESYTPLVFGVRSSDAIKEFEVLSEQISEEIRESCFDNQNPLTSFVTGSIRGDVPTRTDSFHDESTSLEADKSKRGVEITLSDPKYTSEGLKSLLRPF
jgi:hypothetical protein